MLCGSAFKNKGVQLLLDAVVDYMPAPVDVPPIQGLLADGSQAVRPADDNAPFSALAFKVMADPFGKLTFVRIYSGVLQKGSYVLNSTKDKKERISRLIVLKADDREEVDQLRAGDLGAVLGLKDTTEPLHQGSLARLIGIAKSHDQGFWLSNCGCNSVVECQLPKLNVAGSSPVIRLRISFWA